MSRITEVLQELLDVPKLEEMQENLKHPVNIRMNLQTVAAIDLIAEKTGQSRSSTINLILDIASFEAAEVCLIEDEEIFKKHMKLIQKYKEKETK